MSLALSRMLEPEDKVYVDMVLYYGVHDSCGLTTIFRFR